MTFNSGLVVQQTGSPAGRIRLDTFSLSRDVHARHDPPITRGRGARAWGTSPPRSSSSESTASLTRLFRRRRLEGPVNKTRHQSNCPYEDKNKLTIFAAGLRFHRLLWKGVAACAEDGSVGSSRTLPPMPSRPSWGSLWVKGSIRGWRRGQRRGSQMRGNIIRFVSLLVFLVARFGEKVPSKV